MGKTPQQPQDDGKTEAGRTGELEGGPTPRGFRRTRAWSTNGRAITLLEPVRSPKSGPTADTDAAPEGARVSRPWSSLEWHALWQGLAAAGSVVARHFANILAQAARHSP